MNKAESCKILCKDVIVSGEQAKFINKRILQHYQFNWVVDGLPAARLMFDPHTHRVFNNPGFELGRIVCILLTWSDFAVLRWDGARCRGRGTYSLRLGLFSLKGVS